MALLLPTPLRRTAFLLFSLDILGPPASFAFPPAQFSSPAHLLLPSLFPVFGMDLKVFGKGRKEEKCLKKEGWDPRFGN